MLQPIHFSFLFLDEQGLQLEKQKASLKIKESKGKHLSDVLDRVIEPMVSLNFLHSILAFFFYM
jgi:hypothetical protein